MSQCIHANDSYCPICADEYLDDDALDALAVDLAREAELACRPMPADLEAMPGTGETDECPL